MRIKKILSILAMSTLMIVNICGCSSEGTSESVSETTEAKAMTSDEFTKMFQDDTDKAEEENKGKIFEITGEYAGDLLGSTVQIATSEVYGDYPKCELRFDVEKENFEKIAEVNKGDIVTLKAKFKRVTSYTLEFTDTLFMKKSETTKTEQETDTDSEASEPEHNTSAYVDYIAAKAKADAENATEEDIQAAVNWLKKNTGNYFSGSENMEKTMYYGELLEYKYKDTGNELEKIGWQAFKTVKYVYRGAETVLDDATHNNLQELKDMLENLSESSANQEEVSETEKQTEAVTEKPTEKITEQVVAEQPQEQEKETEDPDAQITVYRTKTGKKYHYENPCGPGTYIPCTLAEAKAKGLTPCEKCVLH